MSYAEDAPDLATNIAFWSQGLTNPTYPIEELGKLGLDVARKFRALAIMLLLSEASTDLFLHNLHRAGKARLLYLQRLAGQGITSDFFQGAGRYGPLLSAVAAADWVTAKSIVDLSAPSLLGGEYEDDHCVGQIVGRLLRDPAPPPADFQPYFDRFEAYLELDRDPRLNVLRALVARDQAEFDEAFEDVLSSFQREIRAAKKRRQLEEPVTLALREVDVDALAFLRLAERQGLTVAEEYRFCPSLARRPMQVPFPPA